ncbi:MAG: HlyD family efflux transporter periplasmic adaptor subunit, partial [Pirellulaceae bacterium]|nr:HlyD family efflux transporter periplasmic adaptor subunit [Pirellulaceae bacterium]
MSTGNPLEFSAGSSIPSAKAVVPPPVGADTQLVQETKAEIRTLVHEITRLAQSDLDVDEFFGEFLSRVVSALAGVGGAVWGVAEDGRLELRHQVNMPRTGLSGDEQGQHRHTLLLRRVFSEGGRPQIVAPHSGPVDDEEAGNPTEFLLVLGAVQVEGRVSEIVEVFQRPTGGPTTQRGYLRFLAQMCDLANDFLTRRRLRMYNERQALWEDLEQFIRSVHARLDVSATAYTMANEARRIIGCDRVAVAVAKSRRCQIEAVSGLDSLDRRAEEVSRLSALATRVVAARQPLWSADENDPPAPQIELALDAYLDVSHAKSVAVIPLSGDRSGSQADGGSDESHDDARTGGARDEIVGALIIEQLKDASLTAGGRSRVDVVAEHCGSALANAVEHDRLFLMPLWRALGKAKWIVSARNLPKTLLVAAAIAGVLAGLVLVPAELNQSCPGRLQPVVRNHIYAKVDGEVEHVDVSHEQSVAANDLLVRMSSLELTKELNQLGGDLASVREEIRDKRGSQTARLTDVEQQRLENDIARLGRTAASLEDRIRLLETKERKLEVRSIGPGQVVTWKVAERLAHKPVQRGDLLMTLIDPSGPWELELVMPERRVGHVERAFRESPDGLPVTFVLSTHPDREFTGRLTEIQKTSDVDQEQGNAVRM